MKDTGGDDIFAWRSKQSVSAEMALHWGWGEPSHKNVKGIIFIRRPKHEGEAGGCLQEADVVREVV